jgi:hypothetical protein
MASPGYRFSRRLEDQPADSAGRRWYLKEAADAAVGGPDLRAELLARALFTTGGVVIRPTLGLAGSIATITGPALGVTLDGLAPLLADPDEAGVDLDLDDVGSGFADGDHRIVLTPTPVVTPRAFTTPAVSVRDPQGNVVQTVEPETIVYELVERLGAIELLEGDTPEDDEVLLALVTKTASVWSDLEPAGAPPRLRARLEDVFDVDVAGRQDGYVLAWDEGVERHVYRDPATLGSGS